MTNFEHFIAPFSGLYFKYPKLLSCLLYEFYFQCFPRACSTMFSQSELEG